jgi:hypothetical protein
MNERKEIGAIFYQHFYFIDSKTDRIANYTQTSYQTNCIAYVRPDRSFGLRLSKLSPSTFYIEYENVVCKFVSGISGQQGKIAETL